MAKVKKVIENKNHWKTYFDHEYIGGFSLTDMDAIVKITKYATEIVKNPKTKQQAEKFILYVTDAKGEHKMVVNKTNAGNIERALGTPDPAKWVGREIQLYTERGHWFGKDADALRVRDVAPTKEKVDVSKDIEQLSKAETVQELKTIYQSLENWNDDKVVAYKEEMKIKLS